MICSGQSFHKANADFDGRCRRNKVRLTSPCQVIRSFVAERSIATRSMPLCPTSFPLSKTHSPADDMVARNGDTVAAANLQGSFCEWISDFFVLSSGLSCFRTPFKENSAKFRFNVGPWPSNGNQSASLFLSRPPALQNMFHHIFQSGEVVKDHGGRMRPLDMITLIFLFL